MPKHTHEDDAFYRDCMGCNPRKIVYLGDGLYAEYDGYQIELLVNDPINPTDKVALEPKVLEAFLEYVKQLKEALS